MTDRTRPVGYRSPRKQSIIARDYCGGRSAPSGARGRTTTKAVRDDSMPKGAKLYLTAGRIFVGMAVTGFAGGLAATITNRVMSNISINGETAASIDPIGMGIGVAMIALVVQLLPYLPGRVGR